MVFFYFIIKRAKQADDPNDVQTSSKKIVNKLVEN